MGLWTGGMINWAVGRNRLHILSCITLGFNTPMARIPSDFQQRDCKRGEKLSANKLCAACHQQKVEGVGHCNVKLNLDLSPKEMTVIDLRLNRHHDQFK